MVRKKVDPRVRQLIENSVKLRQRGLIVLVGDHGKDQVVNLHLMLSKTQVKARPSVLWCYKKELGFSTHRKKRMRQIKKAQERGTHDTTTDDPFELFVSQTEIRWCYYKDSHKVLGQTFGMLVLQDFEAMNPNLLARTVETVEGGGLVVLLLRTVTSLKQLYTMTMDCHDRFRTEQFKDQAMVPRFNERFILSLSKCAACLVLDDELNILPISGGAKASTLSLTTGGGEEGEAAVLHAAQEAAAAEGKELSALVKSLADAQPAAALVEVCKTMDQARAVLTFLDAVSEKRLKSTVALTAGRGRGKSAALGLCLAGAIAYGYANVFVTAPSPENLKTVFEFVLKGLDVLRYEEHLDYEVLASTNTDESSGFKDCVVRVNVFREHRQTIQYIDPKDSARLGQAELLIVDEAAAIPLPTVSKLLGPYLVFLSSTVNGYEGTGRSLSLKLISDLRKRQGQAMHDAASAEGAAVAGAAGKKGGKKVHEERWKVAAAAASSAAGGGGGGGGGGRSLREIELHTPIRYAANDPVEGWLNDLLCLDVTHEHANASRLVCGTPAPQDCELFWVDRDALFSHHKLSEAFLQRLMAMYTAAHYKNSPNDLQLLSDAPAHELFVLLGPNAMARAAAKNAAAAASSSADGGDSKKQKKKQLQLEAGLLPDVLCVVQVAFEGRISKATLGENLSRGRSQAGDLIPWTLSQQFGDDAFAQLCGARVVRIATHPDVQRMGYGGRAMHLLMAHFRGELLDVEGQAGGADDGEMDDDEEKDAEDGEASEEDEGSEGGEDEVEGAASSSSSSTAAAPSRLRKEKVAPRSKLPPLLVPASQRRPPVLHWAGVSFGATQDLVNFWLRLGFELCYLRQTANEVTGEHTSILLSDLRGSRNSSSALTGGHSGGGVEDEEEAGFPAPAAGWLSPFVSDARRRLVNLLAFTFRGWTASMALSLLGSSSSSGGGHGSTRKGSALTTTFDEEEVEESSSSRGAEAGLLLSATELDLFLGAHDLKRLELYARNMADHHLVTDLVPSLARLFFLGFLDADPTNSAGSRGGAAEGGGVSLSMVQKALLLGVGLQHKSVDDLSSELGLPASQVLALFNKALRKVNSHLKTLVEVDTEQTVLKAPKQKLQQAAKAARRMVNADALTLADDLQDGADEAMGPQGMLGKLAMSNKAAAAGSSSAKKSKRAAAVDASASSSVAASAAATALVMADPDLMQYAVKGGDADWEKALKGGGRGTVSLKSGGSGGGGGTKDEVAANVTAAAAAKAAATSPGASEAVERVLADAQAERAEALDKGKKKKRARILGGGFNETKEKAASTPGSGKKKKREKEIKKPEGKYKNV